MSALETVQAFIATWKVPNRLNDAVREYFTPDCVYENVGLTRTTGAEDAVGVLDGFARQVPFISIGVDMLSLMSQGDAVMTERVDHLNDGSGKTLASIRVMGIFKVRGGKISEWRDYFDMTPFHG